MAYDTILESRIDEEIERWGIDVAKRKMFGGLGASNDMLKVNRAATKLFSPSTRESRLSEQMTNALDVFKTKMPRSADVIVSASRRFVGHFTEYALLGAALEREIVLADITLR